MSYKKIPFFIGYNSEINAGFEIRAYPDMISEFTVISVNDFNCKEDYDCTFSPNKRVMSFQGKTVVYYDAEAQLNLIKFPNIKNTMKIMITIIIIYSYSG